MRLHALERAATSTLAHVNSPSQLTHHHHWLWLWLPLIICWLCIEFDRWPKCWLWRTHWLFDCWLFLPLLTSRVAFDRRWLFPELTFCNSGASYLVSLADFIFMVCFLSWNLVMAQNEISKPIHVMLDGDNYSLWAQAMCSFIKGCKLWLYVFGQHSSPKKQGNKLQMPSLFNLKIGMVSISR